MNKTQLKNFAVAARVALIERVKDRARGFGIDEKTCAGGAVIPSKMVQTLGGALLSQTEINQRDALLTRIQGRGYDQVMEETAYTWFNRFIALRYMQEHNLLPVSVRVLPDAPGALPELVRQAQNVELDGVDFSNVVELLEGNRTEMLYTELLIALCNQLSDVLPQMFEPISDYTELLFPDGLLREDSVLAMLAAVDAENWADIQVIGWLYQYYNTELKDDTFAQLKKNVKITKERIPAATQLFTPDWIVRYMVENSLGRLWLEGHPNAELHDGWKYYLDEAKQGPEVETQLTKLREKYKTIKPEEIKVIDPCMGSGHILVYAFDVLMQIYTSAGWDQREAAQSILKNNLYGLDIDDRAAQLAYFAVMMKARQYDRRLLTRGIQPHIYAFAESNTITTAPLHDMGITLSQDEYDTAVKQVLRLLDELRDAKEYGSILTVTPCDWDLLRRFAVPRTEDEGGQQLLGIHGEQIAAPLLQRLINIGEALSQQYDVVVTNPPYMAVSNAGAKVNDYVKKNFPDSKADLFAVFIERCGQMAKKNGYQAMITQHAWMFLSSFEKLRTKLLAVDIVNMAHLGARAFEEIGGEVVQTTSFVVRKSHIADYKGEYCRLIEPTSQQGKEDMFLAGKNRYAADQSNFSKIPGSPVAYWLSLAALKCFDGAVLSDFADTKTGMQTCDNNRFLRLWFEVDIQKECLHNANEKTTVETDVKWIPYNKGGDFRKWYGNQDYVLNWQHDGDEAKAYAVSLYKCVTRTIKNIPYFYRETISWSKISSGSIAFRYYPDGFIFDVAGCCIYCKNIDILGLLGLVNSKVAKYFLNALSPTINFEAGHVNSIPIVNIGDGDENSSVLTKSCISTAKKDWDSYETSWDFKRNPLV